jgi:hypothetical protein
MSRILAFVEGGQSGGALNAAALARQACAFSIAVI